MDLRQFTWDDESAIRVCVAVRNAVSAADSPWVHPATEARTAGHLRYGWDLEPPTPFLAVVDGTVVGFASLSTSERDNLHLAWLSVEIHPDLRRRGHGTAVLEALIDHGPRAREDLGRHGRVGQRRHHGLR